ncbi:hypothetical protein [Streptosporangium sp. NPDC051022]|uniref:hypothetical protein n=1 Tax=Streptosporangium sp. NPDC051022 TaxID=3155752 RepID=UPI003425A07B
MTRRLGPYAPLSATYATDDAIIEAGEKAELLYVRGLAFCAASESDGFITRAQLKRFVGAGMDDVMDRAACLVEFGLWEEEASGFLVRAWLKWNASAEELGRARRKDRERKAAKKAEQIQPEDVLEDDETPSSESADDSARIPAGIQSEDDAESGDRSEGSPDGFQPRAGARVEARARNSLHSTSLNENSPSPQGGARGLRRADSETKFEEFWKNYPRKVGKPDARKAWDKAVKAGANPDDIIAGAVNYDRDPVRRSSEIKFTAHPTTWLNQGRWTDEVAVTASGNSSGWWNN